MLTTTAFLLLSVAALPAWEFDSADELKTWVPNAHLANVSVADGQVRADATDWDPFFACDQIEFAASPWQYVHVRIKANQPGACALFWTGVLDGPNGGLTESKKEDFVVAGTGEWEEFVLFPFWHREGTIRKLRFDVYANAHFDVDFIRIGEWGGDAEPNAAPRAWDTEAVAQWSRIASATTAWSPRLALDATTATWATITATSNAAGAGSLFWGSNEVQTAQRAGFTLRGDGKPHVYNIDLSKLERWRGSIAALGFEIPSGTTINEFTLGSEPGGNADLAITYFGFENGVNRAGRPARVMARVENFGGKPAANCAATLSLPDGVSLADGQLSQALAQLPYGGRIDTVWSIRVEEPKPVDVRVTIQHGDVSETASVTLAFSAAPDVPKADYVPEPRPVSTSIDVAAYYFPGWEAPKKWEPVIDTAPIRKPLLGYYDESKPEVVDWQIKWARENGINTFLVDWYWVKGERYLEHWFEAYRKAKYRDQLNVAIMWANHNAPKTHSREDWRAVTQHWIDHYFNLPAYYRIDNKPAIFLWAPDNLRNDLGSVDEVKAALEESQAMAKQAGYDGITFVAMGYSFAKTHIDNLVIEGYKGITTYHEWGGVQQNSNSSQPANFADVVKGVRASWEAKDKDSGALMYYPVIDTGWDSRPWHGDKAFVIEGRTPALFEDLLTQAKAYSASAKKTMVILGPVNEWGEGSYIEPCTEFGFDMLERIRKVFATTPPESWPLNVGPADIGLDPYDY